MTQSIGQSMKQSVPFVAAVLAFTALALVAAPSVAQVGGQQASASPSGETIFKQRCAMCHAVAGQGGKIGPDLAGVIGRKAGATGFSYSPAMKAAKITWGPETLDGFLAAPTKAVPGARMIVSVSNAQDRKALIAYLATLRK